MFHAPATPACRHVWCRRPGDAPHGAKAAAAKDKARNPTKANLAFKAKKKAKRKAKHLAKLRERGINPNDKVHKPDPERWLPRWKRARYRGRRKRNVHGGGQGAGDRSAMDSSKYDAFAKGKAKQARKDAETEEDKAKARQQEGARRRQEKAAKGKRRKKKKGRR